MHHTVAVDLVVCSDESVKLTLSTDATSSSVILISTFQIHLPNNVTCLFCLNTQIEWQQREDSVLLLPRLPPYDQILINYYNFNRRWP